MKHVNIIPRLLLLFNLEGRRPEGMKNHIFLPIKQLFFFTNLMKFLTSFAELKPIFIFLK